jgi:aryl-alcohol dehydrogenase-like predicted oxidoreductase
MTFGGKGAFAKTGRRISRVHVARSIFDTADVYSAVSEEILGQALKSRRDKVLVASGDGTMPDCLDFI